MIRVNEDWVIDVDNYNYTLQRDLHRMALVKVDGKEVERPVYKNVGYFASLDKALEKMLDEDMRGKLKDNTYSLKEAIDIIQKCHLEWVDLIKGVIKAK